MGVFFAGAHEIIPNKILIIHSCLLSPFNDGGAWPLIFITPVKQMPSHLAPVAFIFFNNKPESPFAMQGSRHFVRCNAEVSPVMKAAARSFFHCGDRCDRLTRPESTGCPLSHNQPPPGPSRPLTPLWYLFGSPYIPSAAPLPSLTGPHPPPPSTLSPATVLCGLPCVLSFCSS